MESRQQMLTLEDFKRELLNRFDHSQKINHYAVLMGLKQVSIITMFCEDFEKVSASIKEASDGMVYGVFFKWDERGNSIKNDFVTVSNLKGDNGDVSKVKDRNYILQQVQVLNLN